MFDKTKIYLIIGLIAGFGLAFLLFGASQFASADVSCQINESQLEKLYNLAFHRDLDEEADFHLGHSLGQVLEDIQGSEEQEKYSALFKATKALEETQREPGEISDSEMEAYRDYIDQAASVVNEWAKTLPEQSAANKTVGSEQAREAISKAYENMNETAKSSAEYGLITQKNIGPPSDLPQLEEDEDSSTEEEVATGENTKVGGIISSDTVWGLEGSPYVVEENLLVSEGVNLEIEPGVEVRVNRDNYIQVMGYLEAKGTKDNFVKFTSNYSTGPRWKIRVGKQGEFTKGGEVNLNYSNINEVELEIMSSVGDADYNNIIVENSVLNSASILMREPGISSYIKHNDFSNNSYVSVKGTRGTDEGTEISYNNFRDSETHAIVFGGSDATNVQIRQNNFYLSNKTALTLRRTDADVAVPNNWWGTTDSSVIDSRIIDFNDDFNLGKVDYQPIIESEISDAGIEK
ncbi:MAG: hypothetical protein ACOC5T_01880 [Elusimicrobiota bacterium]